MFEAKYFKMKNMVLPKVRLCLRAFSTHSDPNSMPCWMVASTGTVTISVTTTDVFNFQTLNKLKCILLC